MKGYGAESVTRPMANNRKASYLVGILHTTFPSYFTLPYLIRQADNGIVVHRVWNVDKKDLHQQGTDKGRGGYAAHPALRQQQPLQPNEVMIMVSQSPLYPLIQVWLLNLYCFTTFIIHTSVFLPAVIVHESPSMAMFPFQCFSISTE